MTQEELERILNVWQCRLQLDHWDIKVKWEVPCSLASEAEIKISNDYEQASLRIQQQSDPTTDPPTRSFVDWTEYDTNINIVHELLHVFEKETHRPIEAAGTNGVMSSSAYEILLAWYQHGAENWVDRLSIILVNLAGVA